MGRWLEVLHELEEELEVESLSGCSKLVHLLGHDVLQESLHLAFAFPIVRLLIHEQSWLLPLLVGIPLQLDSHSSRHTE